MKSLSNRIRIEQAYLDGTDVMATPLNSDKCIMMTKVNPNSMFFDWLKYDYNTTPTEYWINEYSDGDLYVHKSKEDAEMVAEEDDQYTCRTFKVIEVIE